MHIGAHYRSHSTWDPRRHLYEELRSRRGSNETVHTHRGKEILEASRKPRINMYNMALTALPSVWFRVIYTYHLRWFVIHT